MTFCRFTPPLVALYLATLCVAFSGCGKTGPAGAPGQSIIGPQGIQGAPGQTGQTGPTGEDGTSITVVQFCKGVTPTYPSTFPEYGECISGVMYGVYSTNDGFLAELPPGEYSSDGVGASCTFTIGPNCQVSQ